MWNRRILKDSRTPAVLTAVGVVCLILVLIFSSKHTASSVDTPHFSISSSSPIIAAFHKSAASVASSIPSSSSASTTSIPLAKQSPTPVSKTNVTAIDTAPSGATISARELASAGGTLLKSLVNIVCVSGDPSLPSVSGSGVMIDSRGIILTAAHVAQFFLLQDYLGKDKMICVVRTGSPARRAYLAEPIYVSPSWINANPTTFSEASPKGTGQNDFALVAITATATSTPLPTSFPATPLATSDPQLGQQVAIGSYGAQYLNSSQLNYLLYPILVFGSVQSRYTYDTSTVDLVSIIGSAASQEGSSGGGIVNSSGQLMGTITTSSIGGDISTRSLNAITVGHLRRSYYFDTGRNLDNVLAGENLQTLIAGFTAESKQLGAILVKNQ